VLRPYGRHRSGDLRGGGWAEAFDLTGVEAVVEANQLVARVPLANLPKPLAPFQWFAFVGNTDFCPDGNLQGTASNP
jgi:hypothetical protein